MNIPDFDPIEMADVAAPGRKLTITPNEAENVRLKISRPRAANHYRAVGMEEIAFDVHPSVLAARLNRIPGFTASYEPPVHVPTGLGAVVEYDGVQFVRCDTDGEPWREMAQNLDWAWRTNEVIAEALRNGAVVLSEGVTA